MSRQHLGAYGEFGRTANALYLIPEEDLKPRKSGRLCRHFYQPSFANRDDSSCTFSAADNRLWARDAIEQCVADPNAPYVMHPQRLYTRTRAQDVQNSSMPNVNPRGSYSALTQLKRRHLVNFFGPSRGAGAQTKPGSEQQPQSPEMDLPLPSSAKQTSTQLVDGVCLVAHARRTTSRALATPPVPAALLPPKAEVRSEPVVQERPYPGMWQAYGTRNRGEDEPPVVVQQEVPRPRDVAGDEGQRGVSALVHGEVAPDEYCEEKDVDETASPAPPEAEGAP